MSPRHAEGSREAEADRVQQYCSRSNVSHGTGWRWGGVAHVEWRHMVCSSGCRLGNRTISTEGTVRHRSARCVDRAQICRASSDMMTTGRAGLSRIGESGRLGRGVLHAARLKPGNMAWYGQGTRRFFFFTPGPGVPKARPCQVALGSTSGTGGGDERLRGNGAWAEWEQRRCRCETCERATWAE